VRSAPLSEIVTAFDSGFACGKDKLTADGLPHLRPFNIGESLSVELGTLYRVPEAEAPKGRTTLLDGDILFNNTNSIELVGKVALVSEGMKAGYSNHITRIRIERGKAEPRFVAAYLNHLWRKRYFEGRATRWVSQAAFNGDALKALTIPLPPLEEQRRMAAVLDRSARLVKLHREAAAKTRDLIPALFIDMFGDPATNPMGWEEHSFGEFVASSRYGPRFPDRSYSIDGVPVLRTTDIGYDGRTRWEDAPRLDLTSDEIAKYSVAPKTLLVTRTGATIGKVALFDGYAEPCVAGAYLIEFVLGTEIEGRFALEFFRSEFGQSRLVSGGRAVAQPNINAPTVKSIMLPAVPLSRQKAFATLAEAIDDNSASSASASLKAEELHRSLLAEVFGEA
jgi:type I restriction enzyme S subunit